MIVVNSSIGILIVASVLVDINVIAIFIDAVPIIVEQILLHYSRYNAISL